MTTEGEILPFLSETGNPEEVIRQAGYKVRRDKEWYIISSYIEYWNNSLTAPLTVASLRQWTEWWYTATQVGQTHISGIPLKFSPERSQIRRSFMIFSHSHPRYCASSATHLDMLCLHHKEEGAGLRHKAYSLMLIRLLWGLNQMPGMMKVINAYELSSDQLSEVFVLEIRKLM